MANQPGGGDEGEGARLRQYVLDSGYKLAEFARQCGLKSQSGLNNYFDADRIGDRAWPVVRQALINMKLDPTVIRPDALVMNRDKARPVTTTAPPTIDLSELVAKWPAEQLRILYRVLTADESSLLVLLGWLRGKLDIKG